MTDINKIFLDTTLTVESGYSNSLCFVDGVAIDKSRYTLENNELNIYREASNYVSLFYDLNISRCYYFERNLNDYGTIISGPDKKGNTIQNLKNKNIMIFVDGILLGKNEYSVLDSENVALLIIKNDNNFHDVIIYVSNTELTYGILSDPLNQLGPNSTISDFYVVLNHDVTWRLSDVDNSIWVDNNGLKWILEDIDKNRIRFGRGDNNHNLRTETTIPNYFTCITIGELSITPSEITKKTWGPDQTEESNNPENKIGYSRYNTLIFKNGRLVPTSLIKTNADGYSFVEFDPLPSDKFEYYKLNSQTLSYNFEATPGITTYGPRDDYRVKLPLLYDSTVLLGDLARVVVDDLRPGFIICEKDRAGRLMVVDETDESSRIKVLTIHEFSKSEYAPDEYYLEVPEAKNIVDYLSDYDKKFIMIPEILRIFQRVLLDEVHDEVERIKNIRNSSKVDSAHIHKLLSLLGMKLDIKHLNIKQLQEAIDELTNFYRLAGTKQSLNYFNIVQDNTKLINIKQLFTYHKQREKEDSKKTYSYKYNFLNDQSHGEGYREGEKYKLIDNHSGYPVDTGSIVTINSVGEFDGKQNAILSFSADKFEGSQSFQYLPLTLETMSTGATVDVKSIPYMYQYDITIPEESSSTGFNEGDILTSPLFDGRIWVEEVDPTDGRITRFDFEPKSGTKSYENIQNSPLQIQTSGAVLKLIITATTQEQTIIYDTVNGNFDSRRNGGNKIGVFDVKINETAEYEIIMSGGGGSGGAADTEIGSTNDSPAEKGYSGEEITKRIVCVAGSIISCNIGQGGRSSYAKGGGGCYCGSGGAGENNGGMGYNKSEQIKGNTSYGTGFGNHYSIEFYKLNGKTTSGNRWSKAASGSGGGSSSFVYNNKKYIAKGGDGGSATWAGKNGANTVLQGGLGGGGGTKSGSGAYGGSRNPDNSSFTSEAGKDGYIIIRKITQNYSSKATLENNYNIKAPNGTVFKSTDNSFTLVAETIENEKITSFTITPESGIMPVCITNANGEITSYTKSFDLVNIEKSANFTLSQNVSIYNYNVTLRNQGINYLTEQVLKDNDEFVTINVTGVDQGKITNFTYTPTQGTNFVEFYGLSLNNTTHGDGAILTIDASSPINIQNIEREYIDFYTIDELAGPEAYHKEYRFPVTDYGYVNQGSPNSPYPWAPGMADIDYGRTSEGSPNSPNITEPGGADIDYGYVKNRIKGQWVEWWDFERPSDLYPTNHVEIEINILSNENYEQAVTRFYKQFYSLASTVLYIHRLITTYNMGNNLATGITADNPNGGDGRILMGIMTTQPYVNQVITVTNDPARQPDISNN